MSIKEVLDNFQRILDIVAHTSWVSLSILVGMFLLALSSVFTYKSIKLDADKTPLSYKAGIFLCLVLGLAVLAMGAAATVLNVFENPIRRITTAEAIHRLGKNDKTSWLIRLIPYNEKTERSFLSIDALKTLGSPQLNYVFVAPYEELRGYTVSEAVQMVGGAMDASADQRVSAIIFRTKNKHIFPANARGVLQVLRAVEQTKVADPRNKINIDEIFNADKYETERQLLENNVDIESWSWLYYSEAFETYCKLAQKFKCNKKYEAHQYISEFNNDWSPFGYARKNKEDTCRNPDQICKLPEKQWDKVADKIYGDFGARVFLVDNFEINSLGSRYLIDFDKPNEQVIPDIGALNK